MTKEEYEIMKEAIERHTKKVTKSKAAALAFLKSIGGLPEQIAARKAAMGIVKKPRKVMSATKAQKKIRSQKSVLSKSK